MQLPGRPLSLMILWSLLAGPAGAGPAPADEAVLTEWRVPWENTRPRDPYVDERGRVWFVGQRGDYVAAFDTDHERFRRIELAAGAGPHNLIVSGSSIVWYAGNRAAHIGRIDAATGTIETIPMPDPRARDPHTLVFDAGGDVWFTVQGGNFIGKLAVAARGVELIPVPTPRARPYGIVVGPDGSVWATEFGAPKIAHVDPATMRLTEIDLPRGDARPRRLAATGDGSVWFVDYAQGYVGRLDPDTGSVEEWPVPSGREGRPYGMAVDDRDRVWFVETGPRPNRLVGFDTETKRFFSIVDIESGGGSVRHMHFHAPTNTIWFGTDANTLVRAKLPE